MTGQAAPARKPGCWPTVSVPPVPGPWARTSGAAAGSFQAADVRGLHLWLVDDIITTGSTLRAACAELRRAGAARVDVLALARTPRP